MYKEFIRRIRNLSHKYTPNHYIELSHSTKSDIDKESTPMNTLAYSQKLYKNDCLSVLSTFSQNSQALTYFSPSIWSKKRHKGRVHKAFFPLLPTKVPCQLRRAFLTKECNTHSIPNKAKSNYHKITAFKQWKKIQPTISSSFSFLHI